MSSTRALAAAIHALVPDGPTYTLFLDQAKPNENGLYPAKALPWIVLAVHLPNPASQSLAGARQAERVRVTATVAGLTRESVRGTYDKLTQALDGALPVADGWNLTRVREESSTDILEDPDLTLTEANRLVLYTVVTYQLTATRTT
ncbi:hypothetical protein NQ036_06805 [Brevibacterium sp. 91QC2O2]|uniref:hypothetical protein n=1 Tax=Brevibacterium sp. 91QC2O2 TaxID=2968458 RepID=UPI00211BF212|nr:hypothetical protein [Brevibacterium sp. 91QC2O2]MCQ9367953.1 hypothetical protein [Brevibacterium sp. 91QC2O2]